MPITSDGIMNKIKDGFTKIKSVEQLDALPIGKYRFLNLVGIELKGEKTDMATWCVSQSFFSSKAMADNCTAFRHVPDAAMVVEIPDGGFEKKTAFAGVDIYRLSVQDYDWAGKPRIIKGLATELLRAYDELGRRAAELAQFKQKLEWAEKLFSNDPEAFHIMRANISRTWSMDNQKALAKWILGLEYSGMVAELAQLNAAREWQPVTVEALENAPDGSFEFFGKDGLLNATVKYKGAFIRGYEVLTEHYSHYRLITRADEFTPPERKIPLNGEYTVAELEQILKESE